MSPYIILLSFLILLTILSIVSLYSYNYETTSIFITISGVSLFVTIILYVNMGCYIAENKEVKINYIKYRNDTLIVNDTISTQQLLSDIFKNISKDVWNRDNMKCYKFVEITCSQDTNIYYSVCKNLEKKK